MVKGLWYTPHQYQECTMPHSPEDRKRAITRLHRIRGQADALAERIATGASCGDVLQQLAAIRGGVNGLMHDVLQGHLRESFGVADAVPGATLTDEQRRLQLAVDEAVALVRTYLK